MLELMYLTNQFEKILMRGDESQKEALLRTIKQTCSSLQGAKESITQEWFDQHVKKRGGVMSWISLGYLNSSYLEEHDVNTIENRALSLLLKSAVLHCLEV